MIPKSFESFSPKTVDETVSFLDRFGPDAKILAGGQSLIPLMKLRLASPKYLVDINRISGLEYIRERDDSLLIGALTRHHSIEKSSLVKERAIIMSETASLIGDPQVRNNGTIGGSLVHADPAGDWGATVIALRGILKATSSKGRRTIKADEFFVDTLTSALKPNELLTEIQVPLPAKPRRSGGAYVKFERKAGDFATVGVAVQLAVSSRNECEYAGVGLTALGPTSTRATKCESLLLNRTLDNKILEEAAEAAASETQPTDDPLRGSSEYRRAMTKVFTKCALTQALSRTGKSGREVEE